MRRSRATVLAAMTCGVLPASCNLVANLGQFDNSTEAVSDASASRADASSPVDDAAIQDGEAPATNVGDASDGQAGAPPRWCITNSTAVTAYCRDFDDGASYLTGWSTATFFNPRDFASLDSTHFAPGSPPSSLLLTTPLLEAGDMPAQELFTKSTTIHGTVDLKFAVMISNFDEGAGDVSLVRIAYPGNTWWVSLDYAGTYGQLLETLADTDAGAAESHVTHPVPPIAKDQWVNVEVVVNAEANTASVSYDGVQVLAPTAISSPPESPAAWSVQIGINYLMGPAHAMNVWYDNMLVDVP